MDNKTIVLFDMDGTLTPARMPADSQVGNILAKLSKHAKIGIVTGSGFDYLVNQCNSLWSDSQGVDPKNIVLLPCNGTKVYSWVGKDWELQSSTDMREEIGNNHFDLLMKILISAQFTYVSNEPSHPFTGHFISYRDTMVNWSPVGRNANPEQRAQFVQYDQKTDMRFRLMTGVQAMLNKVMGEEKIRLSLGGDTSIDIYPTGWDKTYALQHFPGYECWFVGDRCEENGNDKTIYDALSNSGRSYKTTGPEMTVEIISDIINRLIKS